MPFTGVVKAPELIPNPCGLLSVAKVYDHSGTEDGERWVRGFDQEDESNPTVRLLTKNDDALTGGTLADQAGTARYQRVVPFFIEVEDYISMFGVLGEDRFARALRQIEAATQKALERELWAGPAALADSVANATAFLTKTSLATVISHADSMSVHTGLARLEQSIAGSPIGEQGIIHLTRDVASALGNKIIYGGDNSKGLPQLMTRLGTPVVIGSGYTGNGPIGATNAAGTATTKWMFASGAVEVHLGKPEIVNESLAQGAAASTNDMRIKAVRAAGVYLDTSVLQAIRVDITA